MAIRTSKIFAALGQEGAVDVMVVLLQRAADGATVGEVTSDAKVSQATATRRLQELGDAGLLEQVRRGHPFRLREVDRVRALLHDTSELAELLHRLDEEAEQEFRDSLR